MPRPKLYTYPSTTLLCTGAEGKRILEALQRVGPSDGGWPLLFVSLNGRRVTAHWAAFGHGTGSGKLFVSVAGATPPEGLRAWLESAVGELPMEYVERQPELGEQTELPVRR